MLQTLLFSLSDLILKIVKSRKADLTLLRVIIWRKEMEELKQLLQKS